jgi:hypothetical protein
LAVQKLSGMSSAPSGVPAGSGGLVDDRVPALVVAVSLVGLLIAGVAGLRLATRRA